MTRKMYGAFAASVGVLALALSANAAAAGSGGGPSYGEPPTGVAPPTSNDVRYTSTYDVPWDWAHRFPPMVAPSDHPYVPGCHDEAVTVPGRGGAERIVNVTRCY